MSRWKLVLASRAGPGIALGVVLGILTFISPSDSAYLIGSGLGNMIDPFVMITTVLAMLTPGRWFMPLAIMVGGVTIALVLRGTSPFVETTIAVRIMGGVSASILGCIFAAVAHGVAVGFARLRTAPPVAE